MHMLTVSPAASTGLAIAALAAAAAVRHVTWVFKPWFRNWIVDHHRACLVLAMQVLAGVSRLSSFKVSVGRTTVRAKNFRDAWSGSATLKPSTLTTGNCRYRRDGNR